MELLLVRNKIFIGSIMHLSETQCNKEVGTLNDRSVKKEVIVFTLTGRRGAKRAVRYRAAGGKT